VKMADAQSRMLTPPEVAERLGIDAHKVITFIRRGELVAFDLANPGSRRPRWRISDEALNTFLLRRQSRPEAARVRRQRRQTKDVISFF
jgi:predicted site-specific integrase-resolvase